MILCVERLHDFCVYRGCVIFLTHSGCLIYFCGVFFVERLRDFFVEGLGDLLYEEVALCLCEEVAWLFV